MAYFLKSAALSSEIAQIEALLRRLPSEDILGRMGLTSRRDELSEQLASLHEGIDTLASTALYFGGKPVIGSSAIQADFASEIISGFKDLVVKLWAISSTGEISARGPIHNQGEVELHITGLLHGSMGFLLEEVDVKGQPFFDSPTKIATDKAASLLADVADAEDEKFQRSIETIHPRVFQSALSFFSRLHRAEATIRVVDNSRDIALDRISVDRAYVRLEDTRVDEDESIMKGQLIGLIPYGRRFEFQPMEGQLVKGKVAPTMSESFLQRLHDEQAIGKWFEATVRCRTVKRFGQSNEEYILIDLRDTTVE
jgi:hypothetical protein